MKKTLPPLAARNHEAHFCLQSGHCNKAISCDAAWVYFGFQGRPNRVLAVCDQERLAL
jgi:hypothetical protein